MNKKFLLVMTLAALFTASDLRANPIDDMNDFIMSSFNDALSAHYGDVNAQKRLAVNLYKEGSYQAAFNYFKMAAEKGDAYSQYVIGFMYSHGQGVEKDELEACNWLGEAANKGNVDALYELALLYVNELPDFEANEQESLSDGLFRTAAYKGHAKALERLGINNFYQAKALAQEFCDNEYRFKKLYVGKNIIVRGKVSSIEDDLNNNPVVIIEEYGPPLTFIKCTVSPEDPDIYNVKKNNFATIEGKLSEAGLCNIRIKNGVIKSAD